MMLCIQGPHGPKIPLEQAFCLVEPPDRELQGDDADKTRGLRCLACSLLPPTTGAGWVLGAAPREPLRLFGVLSGSPVVPVTAAAPPTCLPNHYRCNSGACIVNSWVCDGYKDCTDGSDEDACPTSRKLFSSSPSLSQMPGGIPALHPSDLHRKFGHPNGSHPPAGWEDIAI